MNFVSVKADIDAAVRKLDATAAESKKAAVRALNKTSTTAKAQAAREVRDAGYGLKISDIKDAFSVRRATESTMSFTLNSKGRPVPLIKFSARQTKKGVTVSVKGGRKLIANAFIATMPSGHKGVYLRSGRTHKKVTKGEHSYWSGLPINQLFGPTIPSQFAADVVQAAVVQAIKDRFPDVMRQELAYVVSKR